MSSIDNEFEFIPVIDTDRLRIVLEHITAHPNLHGQSAWAVRVPSFGVRHCVAGWTVALDPTYKIDWRVDSLARKTSWAEFAFDIITGDRRHIRSLARDLLGFTNDQANIFFDVTNSRYRLWGYASTWTDGVIQRPSNVTPSGFRP